jgi:hypothetical protein
MPKRVSGARLLTANPGVAGGYLDFAADLKDVVARSPWLRLVAKGGRWAHCRRGGHTRGNEDDDLSRSWEYGAGF